LCLVSNHSDGHIVSEGKNWIRVHGVCENEWQPCGINKTYTTHEIKALEEAIQNYG